MTSFLEKVYLNLCFESFVSVNISDTNRRNKFQSANGEPELERPASDPLISPRDTYHQQISKLRDEVDEKMQMIEGLKE